MLNTTSISNTTTNTNGSSNAKSTPAKRLDSYPSDINPFGADADEFSDEDENGDATVVPEPKAAELNNSIKLKETNGNVAMKKAPAIPTSIPRPISSTRLATPPKKDNESNKENVASEKENNKPVNGVDESPPLKKSEDDNKHTYANE